jgi:ribosomal protein S18 acetylase RimI-like enzyme
MGPVIRAARPDDRKAIEDALTASAAFSGEEIRVALELFDEGAVAGYYLFVVEADGAVGGYVCVGPVTLTQSSWYLYWICVHPRAQGRGCGRRLQQHAEDFVRSQGGQRLVLETSGRPDYDRARRFYQQSGYERAGFIRDFYRPGDDCIVYVKRLDTTATAGD